MINSELSNIPLIQANYSEYPEAVKQLKQNDIDLPRNVSIEIQVKCNAKCSFCAYPVSPRQGQKMQRKLFLKIIDELSNIPQNHHFGITLHRLSEPLLDRRMQYFHEVIAEKLPSAFPLFWSNGTMIRKGAFEWMSDHPQGTLTISLNSVNEEEHISLMGLGVREIFENLDYLHRLVDAGTFTVPVTLVAPFISKPQAMSFSVVCRARWPLFKTGIRPFFKWTGETGRGEYPIGISSNKLVQVQDSPCGQWFDLHILANGTVTKCCIDETGFAGNREYDVKHNHVLDIYKKGRKRREKLPARSAITGCRGCYHLG